MTQCKPWESRTFANHREPRSAEETRGHSLNEVQKTKFSTLSQNQGNEKRWTPIDLSTSSKESSKRRKVAASSVDTTIGSQSEFITMDDVVSPDKVPETPPHKILSSDKNPSVEKTTSVTKETNPSVFIPAVMETTNVQTIPREPSIHQVLMDALDVNEALEQNQSVVRVQQVTGENEAIQGTDVEVLMAEAAAAHEAQAKDKGKKIIETWEGSGKEFALEDQHLSQGVHEDSDEEEESSKTPSFEDSLELFSCKEAREKYPTFAHKITYLDKGFSKITLENYPLISNTVKEL